MISQFDIPGNVKQFWSLNDLKHKISRILQIINYRDYFYDIFKCREHIWHLFQYGVYYFEN